MSFTKFSRTLDSKSPMTRNALHHANSGTIPPATKQPNPALYTKIQSLRKAFSRGSGTSSCLQSSTAITRTHLRTSKAAHKHCCTSFPEFEATTPNPFPSNEFQYTAIQRRLVRAVLDCREVACEEWRTIIGRSSRCTCMLRSPLV
jgi:hypothetical protein